jgi:hypothetical protein
MFISAVSALGKKGATLTPPPFRRKSCRRRLTAALHFQAACAAKQPERQGRSGAGADAKALLEL